MRMAAGENCSLSRLCLASRSFALMFICLLCFIVLPVRMVWSGGVQSGAGSGPLLVRMQARIVRTGRQQLMMGALLDNSTSVHDHDPVRMPHR
jgi:hypothetical protein